jgi:effector-binding domain-containing protein
MSTEPSIVERPELPYVSISRSITMPTFHEIADRLPGVFEWLGARGIEPAGPPFFKYNVIDMERELEMEAGVPVAAPVEGDGEVRPGVLPAGRYAVLTHVGHPQELVKVTAGLLDWATEQGLEWDKSQTGRGERWRSRLEVLLSNPAEEPDMNKWVTRLEFRLASNSA